MALSSLNKINVFFTSNERILDKINDADISYIKTRDMRLFHVKDHSNSTYFNYLNNNYPELIESYFSDNNFIFFVINSRDGDIFKRFFDMIYIINPVNFEKELDFDLNKNGCLIENYNLFGCPALDFTYIIDHPNKNRIRTYILEHLGYNLTSLILT